MVVQKVQITYTLTKPLVFNPDFCKQIKVELAAQQIELERADHSNLEALIKDNDKASAFLKKHVDADGLTENALDAVATDTNKVIMKYQQNLVTRWYTITAVCTVTYADTTKRLLKYIEKRFRELHPAFGSSFTGAGTSK